MLILNADDYGMNCHATERILTCCEHGRITSISAMVFMEDSCRAAELVRHSNTPVGLHLNFSHRFSQGNIEPVLLEGQSSILSYLRSNKYNSCIYNPKLKKQFRYVFETQLEEFERIYGKQPLHIDGHHHMHLCANLLYDRIIPAGYKVRRNFTFQRGEKNIINRMYRCLIDMWLSRRYQTTDYFYSLSERVRAGKLAYVLNQAKTSIVELEVHPENDEDYEWLMGDEFLNAFKSKNLQSDLLRRNL